jgi:hypothetical protein
MAINVFQIFYDANTRKKLDPAFLPLDNSLAARPDWLEYWPIRTVLLNRSFADTDYVGFLRSRDSDLVLDDSPDDCKFTRILGGT